VQISHALENHTHPVCSSKIENHLHEEAVNCDFHFFKLNQGYLFADTYKAIISVQKTAIIDIQYNFLKGHQPLSYPLRGPPLHL
jgi:hypothetical protein